MASHAWVYGARVLIAGGMGFIGSTLARRLVRLGATVTLVDCLIPECGGNLRNIAGLEDRVTVRMSDVRDPGVIRDLVRGQDLLFNLAGQSSHQDSMEQPFTDLQNNCVAPLSILEACRAHNPSVKIVFASTRQVYGKPQYLPVDEEHPLRPIDVNGIHKLAAERYHVLYNHVHGIRSCSLRLTNTYGPRMRVKDARQTFLGIWVRRVLEGKPIELWGGQQLRDFTYVEDVTDAMLLAARDPQCDGKTFNLGGERAYSLREVAHLLVRENGSGEYILREFPPERRKIDIGDYYANWHRFSEHGWEPEIRLADGIRATLDYYRAELPHYL